MVKSIKLKLTVFISLFLLQFVFLLSLTSILLYQLIGITIDFFAFNTITKIDIKSNENDINYPFITLSFDEGSNENYCVDWIWNFETDGHRYDISCNTSYLQNITNGLEGAVDWKIYYLLNCRQHSFTQIDHMEENFRRNYLV